MGPVYLVRSGRDGSASRTRPSVASCSRPPGCSLKPCWRAADSPRAARRPGEAGASLARVRATVTLKGIQALLELPARRAGPLLGAATPARRCSSGTGAGAFPESVTWPVTEIGEAISAPAGRSGRDCTPRLGLFSPTPFGSLCAARPVDRDDGGSPWPRMSVTSPYPETESFIRRAPAFLRVSEPGENRLRGGAPGERKRMVSSACPGSSVRRVKPSRRARRLDHATKRHQAEIEAAGAAVFRRGEGRASASTSAPFSVMMHLVASVLRPRPGVSFPASCREPACRMLGGADRARRGRRWVLAGAFAAGRRFGGTSSWAGWWPGCSFF